MIREQEKRKLSVESKVGSQSLEAPLMRVEASLGLVFPNNHQHHMELMTITKVKNIDDTWKGERNDLFCSPHPYVVFY